MNTNDETQKLHDRCSVVFSSFVLRHCGWLSRHRCSSCYGHRHVLGVFQRKFSQLHRDLLDAESFQQMRCQPIGECLDQICRLISYKILRFLRNDRIIDRVVDVIGHIGLLVIRPERNADGQSLRRGPFLFRNSDARGNFELLDMNPIGERIWFVGHSPRSLRCRTEQHSFRRYALSYFASFGAPDASFWKRGSFRSGSNIGSSRSSAGVSGTF